MSLTSISGENQRKVVRVPQQYSVIRLRVNLQGAPTNAAFPLLPELFPSMDEAKSSEN